MEKLNLLLDPGQFAAVFREVLGDGTSAQSRKNVRDDGQPIAEHAMRDAQEMDRSCVTRT